MMQQSHLEAAESHLESACKHLAAARGHNDGKHEQAERLAQEALAASRVADGKSTEAHWLSLLAVKEKVKDKVRTRG